MDIAIVNALINNDHVKRGKKRNIENVTPPVPMGRVVYVSSHENRLKKQHNVL
jgi:hypothetical protein